MEENPYSALKLDPTEEVGQAPPVASAAPVEEYTPNPYTKVKNELTLDDTLQQNPQVADHLSNWAKFSGHGIITGLSEVLGMPIDTINSANEFIKNYPNVAASARHLPVVGPLLMGAQGVQALKGDDKPVYAGSTESFKNIAHTAGLPTSSPEEEGVTDWSAKLGFNIGEFGGANAPFAAAGIAKEATSVGTSLARKAWNVFYHEAVPAVSIGSGAFIGEEVIPGDEGKTIGAVAGSLRLSAVKAAFSGVRSAKDWVKGFYSAEPRVARNIGEAASDLPKAVEALDKQPEMSPGAEIPVDIQTEDPGLIALVRTVRDKDRDLAGLYDQQYRATEDAIKADAQYSRANYPDSASYLRDKMGQWKQLAHRRVQQAVEEANRAFETAVGSSIPNQVEADKFKNLQSTLARGYLLEARDDMRAVTESKWEKVDKSVPVGMDPVYDEINAIRKEHKERPGQSKASFPQDTVDEFFDKEVESELDVFGSPSTKESESPKFGPGARLQDAVDLDSTIHRKIGEALREPVPDRVRIAYLTRISKALQRVKEGVAPSYAPAGVREGREVFHGSHVKGIASFDRTKGTAQQRGMDTASNMGTWFTTTSEDARKFGPEVYRAKLAVKNPLRVQGWQGMQEIADEEGLVDKKTRQIKGSAFRQWLLDNGYDGVHMAGGEDNVKGIDYWISLHPEQVDLGASKLAHDQGTALKEANAATKEFHDTFSKGPVGNILGHDAPGYDKVTPGETIGNAISQGPGGIDSFGAFMRAVAQKAGEGNAPEFLEKYLRQDFYDAAMPNGQFNASRAQQWFRNNTGPLGHPGFEKLRQEVEDAIKSQGESSAAKTASKLNERELKQHSVALFLKEPGKMFSGALHSTEQFSQTRKLLDLTEADTTGKATDGLVQMAFDRMIKDSIAVDHATPELQHVNGKQVHDWFEQNQGMIKAMDEKRPGVAARFKRIAETARKNELHRLNPKIPGVSEKAATLALNDIVARITGAKVFTHLFGGHGGSSIQIASIGSQAFKKWAQALKPDDAIRILAAAMNDPKLFKALTKSITDEKEMAKAIQVFEPYWVSMQIPLIQSGLTQPAIAGQAQGQ